MRGGWVLIGAGILHGQSMVVPRRCEPGPVSSRFAANFGADCGGNRWRANRQWGAGTSNVPALHLFKFSGQILP